MSEKRKDKRGRILRDGETQSADGRYRYSYIDCDGKRKQVYSWRLTMTDPLPKGKRDCFTRLIENRKRPMKEPVIDGYSGFLILDKNENPTLALHWEHYFQFIRNKYNNHYDIPLPKVTPHVLRHTYCTRKALSGMNPKILQHLMGHSNIEITLGYYTHARYEDAKAELDRLKNCSTEAGKPKTVLNFKACVKTG